MGVEEREDNGGRTRGSHGGGRGGLKLSRKSIFATALTLMTSMPSMSRGGFGWVPEAVSQCDCFGVDDFDAIDVSQRVRFGFLSEVAAKVKSMNMEAGTIIDECSDCRRATRCSRASLGKGKMVMIRMSWRGCMG
ncbi:hypothetical protein Droror1_Dr00024162 [Drosera rotundifolia]